MRKSRLFCFDLCLIWQVLRLMLRKVRAEPPGLEHAAAGLEELAPLELPGGAESWAHRWTPRRAGGHEGARRHSKRRRFF